MAQYDLPCFSDKGAWPIIRADAKIKAAKIKTKGILAFL